MHNFYKLIEFVVSVVSIVSTPVKFRQNLPPKRGYACLGITPAYFPISGGYFTQKNTWKKVEKYLKKEAEIFGGFRKMLYLCSVLMKRLKSILRRR